VISIRLYWLREIKGVNNKREDYIFSNERGLKENTINKYA
jgi:hypothetical protein